MQISKAKIKKEASDDKNEMMKIRIKIIQIIT